MRRRGHIHTHTTRKDKSERVTECPVVARTGARVDGAARQHTSSVPNVPARQAPHRNSRLRDPAIVGMAKRSPHQRAGGRGPHEASPVAMHSYVPHWAFSDSEMQETGRRHASPASHIPALPPMASLLASRSSGRGSWVQAARSDLRGQAVAPPPPHTPARTELSAVFSAQSRFSQPCRWARCLRRGKKRFARAEDARPSAILSD